jgi:hypothetical protein
MHLNGKEEYFLLQHVLEVKICLLYLLPVLGVCCSLNQTNSYETVRMHLKIHFEMTTLVPTSLSSCWHFCFVLVLSGVQISARIPALLTEGLVAFVQYFQANSGILS